MLQLDIRRLEVGPSRTAAEEQAEENAPPPDMRIGDVLTIAKAGSSHFGESQPSLYSRVHVLLAQLVEGPISVFIALSV